MKIVVIGGSGLIGSKLVRRFRSSGHEAIAASPSSGVDTVSGQGLAEALDGAHVVVDVANAPSFEDQAVLAFFDISGRNLLAAERAAGVGHHLALSIVGAERCPNSGYLCAKLVQEGLIKKSGIPYTIVRSTQFFEFVQGIIDAGTAAGVARLSPALLQPIAAEDAAAALADLAVAQPLNAVVEVAGPNAIPLDELARKFLAVRGDERPVIADVRARYFGTELDDRSLTPRENARIGPTTADQWLSATYSARG